MGLFRCSKCGCVEDTALCHYWSARLRRMPVVCSLCDPAIAKWHGEFPRQLAQGWATGQYGALLWNKSEVEEWLGTSIEVIGKAASPPLCADEAVEPTKIVEPTR